MSGPVQPKGSGDYWAEYSSPPLTPSHTKLYADTDNEVDAEVDADAAPKKPPHPPGGASFSGVIPREALSAFSRPPGGVSFTVPTSGVPFSSPPGGLSFIAKGAPSPFFAQATVIPIAIAEPVMARESSSATQQSCSHTGPAPYSLPTFTATRLPPSLPPPTAPAPPPGPSDPYPRRYVDRSFTYTVTAHETPDTAPAGPPPPFGGSPALPPAGVSLSAIINRLPPNEKDMYRIVYLKSLESTINLSTGKDKFAALTGALTYFYKCNLDRIPPDDKEVLEMLHAATVAFDTSYRLSYCPADLLQDFQKKLKAQIDKLQRLGIKIP